jgi:SAM-dependent methyltransferase
MENTTMQKLYNELSTWWPLLSPVGDYTEEAAFFLQVVRDAGLPPNPSLLELGCGGGSNAYHLKPYFPQMTLTDLSPQMLAISQTLNPECEHLQGDMRTLRLNRTFDVVFVHDAIDYMLTLDDLHQALETAAIHWRSLCPIMCAKPLSPPLTTAASTVKDEAYVIWSGPMTQTNTTAPISPNMFICYEKGINQRTLSMMCILVVSSPARTG